MSFGVDLQYSLDSKVLDNYYKECGIEYIQTITDLELQKQGIDKVLHYKGSKTITVDEKKRRTKYDDLLVETIKNVERNKKGWLYYTKADYIIYWIVALNKFYVINFKKLQKTILDNDWHNTKPKKVTYLNLYYTTENIVIQWSDLDSDIYKEIKY